MIDPVTLQAEIDSGVSAICATCEHHWEGKAKGLGSCGDATCLGPSRAGTHPNYKGPMSRDKFPAFCIRCLNPKISFQVVIGAVPAFGLCHYHRRTFEFLKTGDGLRSVSPLLIPV